MYLFDTNDVSILFLHHFVRYCIQTYLYNMFNHLNWWKFLKNQFVVLVKKEISNISKQS